MYYESCLSYSKLGLYINIFDANSKATYLHKPLTFTQRRNLARFRLGTLPLRSETANYLPKPVPIEAKLCLNCSRNEIESMEHLFYCTRHEQLRVELYSKIGVPPLEMTIYDKIKIMTNHPDTIKLVAKYITDCYNNCL